MSKSNGESNGKRLTYAVYRLATPGAHVDGNLAHALRQALDAHRGRFGDDPAGLVINTRLVEKAREVLASVEVSGCGGCLTWEAWLATAPPSAAAPSLAQAGEVQGDQLRLFGEVAR